MHVFYVDIICNYKASMQAGGMENNSKTMVAKLYLDGKVNNMMANCELPAKEANAIFYGQIHP